jgi:hypothetical protein
MSERLEDIQIEIQTREVIYRINTVSLGDLADSLDLTPGEVLEDIENGNWDEIEEYALANEGHASEMEGDWGLDQVEIL